MGHRGRADEEDQNVRSVEKKGGGHKTTAFCFREGISLGARYELILIWYTKAIMGDIDISQKDPYFIAVKVFLEKGSTFLIMKDKFGEWDLPGGRIKKFEFAAPLPAIIERKIAEELGTDMSYNVNDLPTVLMRHERVEASPGNPTVHIFGLGYRATWEAGEPVLSAAHVEMKWVEVGTFQPEEYFTGGWLTGVQEYLAQRRG